MACSLEQELGEGIELAPLIEAFRWGPSEGNRPRFRSLAEIIVAFGYSLLSVVVYAVPLTQRAPSTLLPFPYTLHTCIARYLPGGGGSSFISASMIADGMVPFTWPKGQKKKKDTFKRYVANITDPHEALLSAICHRRCPRVPLAQIP